MAQILIPKTNPVKYVPLNMDGSKDSIRLDDRYNFDFLPASFEGKTTFNQPWVFGDIIRQQIWSRGVALLFIEVVDCNGLVVDMIEKSGASLNNYLVDGVAWNINQFEYVADNLETGTYYFVLNYGPNTPGLKKEISERFEILEKLDNSVLFKYRHSYNEYNTVFKTSYNSYFDQTFYFRAPGYVLDKNPEGIYTDFDDQKLNRTLLSAKPFDTWLLKMGPMPEWGGSLLNMIRSCDDVMVSVYNISFLEKWEKQAFKNYRQYVYSIRFALSKTEYAKAIDVCEPVTTAALALPDAHEDQPYIYSQVLNGTKPFTLGAITKPSWMQVSIIDDVLYLQTTGTDYPPAAASGVAISILVNNPCGTVTLTDSIDVIAAVACTAPSFTGSNIYPQPVLGQAWSAFIGLTGTNPFTIDSVIKPSWLTITPVTNGIELTGTPNLSGPFVVGFNILNCAGAPGALTYYESFTVSSNINITGYGGPFSNGLSFQTGQILAAPGTLVTINIFAGGGGPIPPHTYTLTVTITGATLSNPLTVTNGGPVTATFVMPASGFVGWSGTYNGSNSAGSARITTS
jgi:hypothetical protein